MFKLFDKNAKTEKLQYSFITSDIFWTDVQFLQFQVGDNYKMGRLFPTIQELNEYKTMLL